MVNQEWKEFEGYFIGNNGSVLNPSGSCVKCFNRNGYKSVSIKDKKYYVHRLVAMLFCDGYKEGLFVDHIDGNPKNNCYKNLRWVTLSENVLNSKERSTKTHIPDQVVLIIVNLKNLVGLNNVEISKVTGVDRRNVSRILNGRSRANLTNIRK